MTGNAQARESSPSAPAQQPSLTLGHGAPSIPQGLPPVLADVVSEAFGQSSRPDPVLPGTGGPAGNAHLTAWTGLVLLALSLAELVTLLDVQGLISWHVVIGTLLIPPALLKTGSTGWRIVRYYRGHPRTRRQARRRSSSGCWVQPSSLRP